ncbi:MAG TPA: M17 family peptidase N-terminal domain-containing protein, partial [Microbacterium sp.]|nr:M17 family peptidase N-terminal domain-containing protein [Microbacterium sp.]
MTRSANKLIPPDFATLPGLDALDAVEVRVADSAGHVGGAGAGEAESTGIGVHDEGDVPAALGFDRAGLDAAGFDGKVGATLLLPRAEGPDLVAVGLGDRADAGPKALRDAGAAFARAAARYTRVTLVLDLPETERAASIAALVEGVLLARYRYTVLASESKHVPLASLTLDVGDGDAAADAAAVATALAAVRAAVVARDLANTPPGHLTATDMADIAEVLGARFGFE